VLFAGVNNEAPHGGSGASRTASDAPLAQNQRETPLFSKNAIRRKNRRRKSPLSPTFSASRSFWQKWGRFLWNVAWLRRFRV